MIEWKEYTVNELKADSKHAIAMGPFGSNIKTDNFVTDGVPVIRGINLSGNKFNSDNFVFLTEEKADELKSSNAFPDDLVFTHRGTLGQVGIVPDGKFKRYVVSQSQIKLTCNKEKVLPLYLYYYFTSPIGKNEILKNEVQTGVPAIASPTESLKNAVVFLPPLPEQKKIARVLGNIDDKIELNRQMNKTLEAMAMTIYRHYFIDFGLPPGVKHETDESPFGKLCDTDELGPIPEGWGIGKISDILFLEYGKSLPDHKRIVGDYPVYGSNGIVGYHNEYISEGPGIIVGRKGTAGQVIRAEKNFFPIDTTFFVKPKIDYYSMNTLYLILIHQKLKEMNFDSAVPGLNRNNAYDIDCIIPPQNVVKDFSKKIDHFFTLIDNMNNEIPLLINTREYLLPKLISGEVKVQ